MANAASNEDRTRDLLLTKEMLCQLSYRGIVHGTLLVAHQKKIVAHSEKNCCTLKKKKVAHLKKK